MSATPTFSKGKIINDENPSDYIYVLFVPEDISEAVDVQYDEQSDIIGRTSPFVGYKSTGARTFEFPLHLFAYKDAEEEVYKRVRWLQSFCYPDYSTQIMRPPKLLRVIFGRTFINVKGFLKSGVSCSWKSPYDVDAGFPMQAEISISFQEVVTTPYDYRDFKPTSLRHVTTEPSPDFTVDMMAIEPRTDLAYA